MSDIGRTAYITMSRTVPALSKRLDVVAHELDIARSERDAALAALNEAQNWAKAALEAHNRVTAERDEALMTSKEAIMRMHEVCRAMSEQCDQRVAELKQALGTARATIHALHGEVAWPEYQHSPEPLPNHDLLRLHQRPVRVPMATRAPERASALRTARAQDRAGPARAEQLSTGPARGTRTAGAQTAASAGG